MTITIDGAPKEIAEFLSALHTDTDFNSDFTEEINEYWRKCLEENND